MDEDVSLKYYFFCLDCEKENTSGQINFIPIKIFNVDLYKVRFYFEKDIFNDDL